MRWFRLYSEARNDAKLRMGRWQEWIFSCHLLYCLQQQISNVSNKYLTEIYDLWYNKSERDKGG